MMNTIHKDRDENNGWTIIDYNWLITKLIITEDGHDIGHIRNYNFLLQWICNSNQSTLESFTYHAIFSFKTHKASLIESNHIFILLDQNGVRLSWT